MNLEEPKQNKRETLNLKTLQAYISKAVFELVFLGKPALKLYGYFPYSFLNRKELLEALLSCYSKSEAYRILAKINRFREEYLKKSWYKELYNDFLKNKESDKQ